MATLSQLKSTAFKGSDLEELMELSAFGHNLRAEYEKRNVPEPEWLSTRLSELGREIALRNSDQIMKRQRELQNQLQSLETPAEKKRRIQQELESLNKQLVS